MFDNTSIRLRGLLLAAMATVIAGCGGGASTETKQQAQPGTQQTTYNGPAPATSDTQAFMVSLWANLQTDGDAQCANCHSPAGGQAPMFARNDDVNLAYAEANPLTDRSSPPDSRLVTKVAGGHNCWLGSAQACADIMTTWIENWVGSTAGGGRQIQLNAPPLNDPGQSKNFPPPVPAEFTPVHDLLTLYCSDCHSNASATPQTPFFADADINVAYDAVQPKIDLDTPASSRLVLRLRNEFHNCWDGDCVAASAEMESTLTTFANSIVPTSVDPALIISKALRLVDGTVASGGNRYESNQIALWEFKSGQGLTAYDTSGVSPAMDLTLSGNVSWVGGWGIDISSGKAQASTTTSRKLYDLLTATGEYAIEAWVAPANVVQEDTRIISYSAGTTARNLTLGQTLYSYDFYNRSGTTDANGEPALSTAAADEDLQATLQHVVVNYDPVNGRRIYVNGVFTGDIDPVSGDTLADWDDSFAFVLGNEVSGDRQWQGVIRMVAIHSRALSEAQIQQNLDAGVGEKFFLLFYVGDLISVPQSYIMFEVSQFDSYSYLFNKPLFISLDQNASASNIPLVGMHIGMNGRIIDVGQAYANLNIGLNDTAGQALSSLGTIVPLEKGPDGDEFFLAFEQLGNNFGPVTPPAGLTPPPEELAGTQPDVGLRTFDEINASMAAVTTVPVTEVQSTFDQIRQQLPSTESADTFSSAQEIGIAQLAIAYCNALLENNDARRDNYFSGFDFSLGPAAAFANRGFVITPLINNMQGMALLSQPDFNVVYDEIDQLVDRLIGSSPPPGGPPANSPQRTKDITKAACAAVLGSGVVLIQ